MDNVMAMAQQFNAADILWVVGAIVLIVIAVKVAAKILKFVLFIAAVGLVLAFLFNFLQ